MQVHAADMCIGVEWQGSDHRAGNWKAPSQSMHFLMVGEGSGSGSGCDARYGGCSPPHATLHNCIIACIVTTCASVPSSSTRRAFTLAPYSSGVVRNGIMGRE